MITLKFQIEIFWFVELVNRYLRSDFNFHPNNFTSLIIFIIVISRLLRSHVGTYFQR